MKFGGNIRLEERFVGFGDQFVYVFFFWFSQDVINNKLKFDGSYLVQMSNLLNLIEFLSI